MAKSRVRGRKKQKMTLEEYREKCSDHLKRILSIGDLLDEDDPYDCHDDMAQAFADKVSPEDFIGRAFAEDIGRQALEEDQYHESLMQCD